MYQCFEMLDLSLLASFLYLHFGLFARFLYLISRIP